jgi:methyl-accepting chemotaxis protein
MKQSAIIAERHDLSPQLAENSVHLTLACSEAAGQIEAVTQQLKSDLNLLRHLEDVTTTLDGDQQQALTAAQETKALANLAKDRITDSFGRIEKSIDDYRNLAEMVHRLGAHVTDFAVVLEQVRSVSQGIRTIARTTNMLALNASIEAERAGHAGRTFAVLADEIKRLAQDTRTATDDITRSVGTLASEASELISEIEVGVSSSKEAEANFDSIEAELQEAIKLVKDVDSSSDHIMGRTHVIMASGSLVRGALSDFAANARSAVFSLESTSSSVMQMEQDANGLFNGMVQTGHLSEDSHFVAMAMLEAQNMVNLVEAAIAAEDISRDAVFDTNYQLIEGSMPERYRNAMMPWADAVWQPELDRIQLSDPRIKATVCSDRLGYLPTHMSSMSYAPTGDVIHDTQFCRNGRIIMGSNDIIAKASDADYYMSVYRHEGDGISYNVIRNVYIPMYILGERWGDFEIAYRGSGQ